MIKTISPEKALHLLAAYCSNAERCEDEVRKKMVRWEISQESQESILSHLQKEDFLNEVRFCKAFVNDKLRFNKWGAKRIYYELARKKISPKLIKMSLEEIDGDENEKILMQILTSKQKVTKSKNSYDLHQKLFRFALGRGFDCSLINASLKRLFEDFEYMESDNLSSDEMD